jgi:hypothetical protein
MQYGTSWYHSHFSLQCKIPHLLRQKTKKGGELTKHQIATGFTVPS